jgi:hypothetical protein
MSGVQSEKGNLDGHGLLLYRQIDKTHQEFTESYANFELWMEDFETSVEKIEHVREVEKDSTVPPSHQTSQ